MSYKNRQTKRQSHQSDLSYRKAKVEPGSEEQRSLNVTLATEDAVQVYDSARRQTISEVLVMKGAVLPNQVPMMDSHDHGSVRSLLGSVRELAVSGDTLRGVAFFGSKQSAREAYDDAREGHLSDISVGARRLEEHYVAKGKTELIGERTIHGPARIVTRWRPVEGSAVPIGADPRSTFESNIAMRAYFDPLTMREEAMSDLYRSQFIALGLPADADEDATAAWIAANPLKRAADPDPVPEPAPTPEPAPEQEPAPAALIARAQKAERDRCLTIRRIATLADLDPKFADTLIAEGVDVETASERTAAEQARRRPPLGYRVEHVGSSTDLFRAAAIDGLNCRISGTAGLANPQKPAPGHKDFQNLRLVDLARKCLEGEGNSTRGLADRDVMRRALALPDITRASDGPAYLQTGVFANLLLDATNKTLLQSFMDVPTTYQMWCRIGESVDDFKRINRVRLGEVGNQPVVPENDEYKDMSLSDSREYYSVEKRGSLVSLTWEAIKNDDLGSFTRIVQLQASAMKRTINRSVYQILFDNPTLSDAITLFHASSHGANLVTSAFTVAVLNTAYSAMALQTGLNSDTILGIVPKYVVHAPGITGTIWSVLNSTADPAAGGSAVGNSGNANIYGPAGGRRLISIEEPILAGNDVDSWYLIADSSQVDTVEVTFLRGEESPVFEQETAFTSDAVKYKIRQTWGVKAIDYRGMYKSTGV